MAGPRLSRFARGDFAAAGDSLGFARAFPPTRPPNIISGTLSIPARSLLEVIDCRIADIHHHNVRREDHNKPAARAVWEARG